MFWRSYWSLFVLLYILPETGAEVCCSWCSAYEEKLVKFVMLISTLSDTCASYVLEDVRRLLYLRDGMVSRSSIVACRKEACRSLARLACLRKALAEVEERGRCFSNSSSADALLELEASLGGALAYRSSDGKHPAVYIQVARLFPTSLYLQVTPADFQKILLRVFDRVWDKLAAASRRHAEKISHGMFISVYARSLAWQFSRARVIFATGAIPVCSSHTAARIIW